MSKLSAFTSWGFLGWVYWLGMSLAAHGVVLLLMPMSVGQGLTPAQQTNYVSIHVLESVQLKEHSVQSPGTLHDEASTLSSAKKSAPPSNSERDTTPLLVKTVKKEGPLLSQEVGSPGERVVTTAVAAVIQPAYETHGAPPVNALPLSSGNRPPDYPRIARLRGWEGEVLVWALVSSYGEVLGSGIEKSSGYEALDRSALQAVSRWRFSPASLGGLFVESRVYVPVTFRLDR